MKIVRNLDLTNYNSYKIKAHCKRGLFFDTEEEIKNYFELRPHQYILMGSGHNVILSKEHYDEDFIIFNGNFDHVEISGETVIVEAGVFTKELCETACKHNLSGLEMFYDIPSSIGGAIVMNAGAGGEEIKDLLIKVRYLDLADNKIKERYRAEIGFEYRNSFFQQRNDKIILKAWLKLKNGVGREIRERMESIKETRWAKQPKEYPNAGSVFKRPKGYYVGAIIDELELKGLSVGGAKVSEKHGGFIVNFNHAKGADIVRLIEVIKEKVYKKFNIILEVEQRII